MEFKDRLREEITYKGLLVKEVAELAGIPKRTIESYIGAEAKIPNVKIAVKIARALGVTVEYLVTGKFVSNNIYENIIQDLNESNYILKQRLVQIQEVLKN